MNRDITLRLNKKSHHIFLSIINELLNLISGHSQRVAHLTASACIILEISHLATFCFQLFGSVKCDICLSVVEQLLHVATIDVATLRLTIRTVRATFSHTFVKFDAEPSKRLIDIIFGSRHKTIGVGIFDAKNNLTAMTASI